MTSTYQTDANPFAVPPMEDVDSTISFLNAGLPVDCFASLSEAVGLNEKELAALVRVPTRTLARRKREGSFPLDEGERVLRLVRIVEKACVLFDDDMPSARRWLNTPHPALGGKTPLEFSDTEPGAEFISRLIGRLEHGVFS